MPICQNCQKKLTYLQTLKMLFRSRCPNCSKKQYLSAAFRKKSASYTVFPVAIIPMVVIFDFTIPFAAFLIFITLFIVIGTYPFYIEFSNEQEPLW
ncbi:hypothetical protein GMD78_17415 [Ornithinibacillus sp. L9]|uniref:Cxxc_20_cxxc protein n=1 Tax=Ornithinibacillus caprae TaxID=2678566 RepID=A0A6N8FNS0_9BACI|nr:hypothetical protein [Ornithinibacillus caprae]